MACGGNIPSNNALERTVDTKSIAAVLLKVAGLILIGACVTQLPSYFPARFEGSNWSFAESVVSAAATVGPALLLGLCLWFFPGTIANKVVAPVPEASTPFEFQVLLLIAVVILGLFLIAHGTVDLVYHVATLVQMQRLNPAIPFVPPSVFAGLIASALEIVIGLAFCLGRGGIARLVERARR
jgi:hypothetical protein